MWGWRRETSLSPPVKIFLLTVPRRCFFCGSFLLFVFRVVCSLRSFGHLLEKGWPLGSLVCGVCCFLSLSRVVSCLWCGTWLYRLLIFASSLSLEWFTKRRGDCFYIIFSVYFGVVWCVDNDCVSLHFFLLIHEHAEICDGMASTV